MKEQAVHAGNREALESLVSFASTLFVGSLLAGLFLQRKGRREQDVGATVFEVFAVFISLALSALAIYACVYALGSGEAIDDSLVTGVATLVVLSAVLLALLAVVARFMSLPGGILMHLSTLSATLFAALAAGVSIFFLSPSSDLILPSATVILAGGAALAWLFLRIEGRSMKGARRAMQKRVISLSVEGYRPEEATLLLGLPEPHTGATPLRVVYWSKKGRSYLDYAGCLHLQGEARRRWAEFEEGETRAPLGESILMDVGLRYRLGSWPPRFRLTLGIYRKGERDAESQTIETNDVRLFDVTGLGLISDEGRREMGSLRESMTGETTMREVVEKELGEEVVVAAALSQGTPPSPLAMVTGAALIKLISPRASKQLPKRFILAVTPDRVVALKGTPISDESGDDIGAHIRGEIASWNRGEVTATRSADGNGGTLQIPGASIPVFDRTLGHPRELELFLALGA